jgi:hypothetical protein
LIDITAHGDWDEAAEEVNFKRGRPAFDSLAGPAGVKKALDYAVKYLEVVGPKQAKSPKVPQDPESAAKGQLDEIINPSTWIAKALRYIGRKFAQAFPWIAVGGATYASSGLLAPLVASAGGAAAAITALGGEMGIFAAAGAAGAATPSIIQTLKDLFSADENSIQAGIKKWVEKQVGDEQDVQEFMLVHARSAYEGKPGFRWRAKEWPVKLSKDQAEAYLEKNDKAWLDGEKAKSDANTTTPDSGLGQPKPVDEVLGGGVDAKGRTQQQWAQLVMRKYPTAKIVQAKMIDGPMYATLPDGRTIKWKKVDQGVAESRVDEFLPALAAGAGALARGAAVGAKAISGAALKGAQSVAPGVVKTGQAIRKVPGQVEKGLIKGFEVLNALVPGGIFNPDGSMKGSQYLTKYLTPQQIQQVTQQQGVAEVSDDNLPQWKKDWYAKQKPNSWPKHPQPYHQPGWARDLPSDELKGIAGVRKNKRQVPISEGYQNKIGKLIEALAKK